MSVKNKNGFLSACPKDKQPNGSCGSDLWERKYVLEGLLAYYELSSDERAIEAAESLVCYTNSQIGDFPRTPITDTGWAFFGMESSSILGPVMKAYQLTSNPQALELAEHIINSGACRRENIFKAALNGKVPKDIGSNGNSNESIAKAYEMMSCFEGLCEYYISTNKKEALMASERFWDNVLKYEITLLGSGGADKPYNLGPGKGEQWNNTRFEQTNPDIELMMETCVTVYWIKLCYKLLCITGNSKYADEIEKSVYNALLGAIRPDGNFFEYFPSFNGKRSGVVNYSFNINGFDLSCCTANGPTGLAVVLQTAVMSACDGIVINFYENARIKIPLEDGFITVKINSEYPRRGKAKITIEEINSLIKTDLNFYFRKPHFAKDFKIISDSFVEENSKYTGYIKTSAKLKEGSECTLEFDIPFTVIPALKGSNILGDNRQAFVYGSLLLCADSRDNKNITAAIKEFKQDFTTSRDMIYEPCEISEGFAITDSKHNGFINIDLTYKDIRLNLCDYMSAGNDWKDSEFISWFETKK